jgi:hypothetical protein
VGLWVGARTGADVVGFVAGALVGAYIGAVVGCFVTGALVGAFLGAVVVGFVTGALVGAYTGADVVGFVTGALVGAYLGADVDGVADASWPNGALSLQQSKNISSVVGQQAPVSPRDLHAGYAEHADGSVGFDTGAIVGDLTGAVVFGNDAVQQSKNLSSVVGQHSPVSPRDLHTGYEEQVDGSVGFDTGARVGDAAGVVVTGDSPLQHSKNISSFVGQHSPVSPREVHAGYSEQAVGSAGSETGALDGGKMGVSVTDASVQQSRNTSSLVGQQYPVKPLASHAGTDLQNRSSSDQSLQQSKKIPSLFGQQSPSRPSQPAFAEHELSDDTITGVISAVSVDVTISAIQQLRRTPSVVGQQSPEWSAHAA